jgi:hypothetical protein
MPKLGGNVVLLLWTRCVRGSVCPRRDMRSRASISSADGAMKCCTDARDRGLKPRHYPAATAAVSDAKRSGHCYQYYPVVLEAIDLQ